MLLEHSPHTWSPAGVTDTPSIPPRAVRLFRVGEPPQCPSGHKFTADVGVLTHAWRQCTKRIHASEGRAVRCEEFVYIFVLGNGLMGVTRIDLREARHIERLQMTPAGVAEFLQLPWRSGMP